MIRSNSDTTTASSPTPVSPFSSDYSVPSEPTSDETPDLGEFTAVLRAWNNLQPPFRVGNSALSPQAYTPSYRTTTSSSDLREDRSTVWAHRPIANYLSPSDTLISESETTDRDQPRAVQIRDGDDEEAESFENDFYDDSDARDESDADEQLQVHDLSLHDAEEQQPSLGFLDSALKFIVAERERWAAQREAGANAAMLSGIEPRRKRRRKRNKTPRAQSTTRTPTVSSFSTSASASTVTASTTFGDDLDSVDDVADALGVEADDSSSSVDQQPSFRGALRSAGLLSSTPGTPVRPGQGRRRGGTGLLHSRSTPQLRFFNREEDEEESSSDPAEESPRIKQLRLLGKKLEVLFPEDRQHLKKVRYQTMSPPAATGHHQQFGPGGFFDSVYTDIISKHLVLGGFVDTRGDPPKKTRRKDERLIHVFVDHSNILIGLLNYLRRYPRQHPQYRDSSFDNSHISTSATSFTTPFVSGTSPHSFPSPYPKPPKHLSHSALSLILERGRPVTRRVMVTSSPLYQPMENAESLGFEVRVFARVPDTGDGMDRERNPGNGSRQSHHRRSQSSGSSFNSYSTNGINGAAGNAISPTGDSTSSQNQRRQRKRAGSMNNNYGGNSKNTNNNNLNNGLGRKKAHNRQMSDNTSAESEQNGGGSARGLSQRFVRAAGGSIPYGHHTYSYSLPASHTGSNSTLPLASAATITNGAVTAQQHQQRVRYREQGVDEVLQLKLHQVIASIDGSPPAGSIIALATGDGNVGQFNEDGFLGAVRTALRRGWNVELYAWEGGLSRAWKREFGEGSEWGAARFKVIGLEQFGSELVEIYY